MVVYRNGGELVGAAERASLVSRTVEVPDQSVRSFLAGRSAPRSAWIAPDGAAIAAAGAAATVTADAVDRFDRVREGAVDVFTDHDADETGPAGPRFYGGFSFHAEHEPGPPWEGFPAAQFVLPRVQLTRTGERTSLTVNGYGPEVDEDQVEATLAEHADDLEEDVSRGEPPGIASMERIPSRSGWRAAVETALARIDDGSLRKVVLAQAMNIALERPVDAPAALARLEDRDPGCHRFLVEPTPEATLFGATPERLVSLRGRTVETEALAGSIGRGESATEDEALARQLRLSEKEGHEHKLVAEAIREQLRPFADDVRTGSRHVNRLASVQHLRTAIRARLSGAEHVLSLVAALHPTPAVGGVPPDVAQSTIETAEPFDRGWYAAPVGWFDAAGDGEFVVSIRSAVASKQRARLYAGAGIVADSDPDEEWEEVQLKYRPILDTLRR